MEVRRATPEKKKKGVVMKIYFIGTSHGAPEKGRGCTSILLETEGQYYVIDAGSSIEKYMTDNGLDVAAINAIFITHMHEDHVGTLTGILKVLRTYHGTARAKIFLPEQQGIDALRVWLDAMHSTNWPENRLPFLLTEEGEVYSDEYVKVSAVKTDHIKGDYPSYAYIIECEGKRVILTGDLTDDLHDYPQVIAKEDFTAVVMELCHYRKEFGFIPGTIDKIKASKTEKIIFTHIYPGADTDMEKIIDTLPFEAHIASDGDIIEI